MRFISDVETTTLLDSFVNVHTYLKLFLPVNVRTFCFVFNLAIRGARRAQTPQPLFGPCAVRVKRAVILNGMINSGSTSLSVCFFLKNYLQQTGSFSCGVIFLCSNCAPHLRVALSKLHFYNLLMRHPKAGYRVICAFKKWVWCELDYVKAHMYDVCRVYKGEPHVV